ncbi:MAG: hypothetical protein IKL07_02560 [Clostridium sp.]|nr:hypothetical protein [Clostridium sp.]
MLLNEWDYILLVISTLLFIEDIKLLLKIAGKTVNENMFMGMMLAITPVITIILFSSGYLASMKPIGILILLIEAEILHQYDRELFYEKQFARLLGIGIVLIFLLILVLKSLARINIVVYVLFNCTSVAYIVLVCYYEKKKGRII